ISDGIHAILIKCPKDSANETCEPHLIISIHMNPSVDLNKLEASWILDEVYDPTKRTISKIISPYLIVVGRGEPVVMYPLQYEEDIKNEYYNVKKNDNIHTKNYLPQERVLKNEIINKFYSGKTAGNNVNTRNDLPAKNEYYNGDNNFKGSNPPKEVVPEYGSKNEYYNAKTTENNFNIGNDPKQRKVQEYDKNTDYYTAKTAENNIYKENDVPQGRNPELDRKHDYYNAKTAEHNIYTGNYPLEERIREQNIKNKYYNGKTAENNIYKENEGKVPEIDRNYDYFNANAAKSNIFIKKYLPQYVKATENIYKGSDLQERYNEHKKVPVHDRKNKYYNAKSSENAYNGNGIRQERVSEHEIKNEYYNGNTPENIIYPGYNLPAEKVPEYDRKNEYYKAKTTNNIYKGSDPPKGIIEYFKAKITDNIYKGRNPPKEAVPEYDTKNEYLNAKTNDNIYKTSDLPKKEEVSKYYKAKISDFYKESNPLKEAVPEYDRKNEYFNVKTTDNINKGSDEPKEGVPEYYKSKITDIYKESKPSKEAVPEYDRKNEYFNAKTTDNINKGSDQPKEGVLEYYKAKIPDIYKENLYFDPGQPYGYAKFPQKKPYLSYPRTNPYRSEPKNYKRIRRSLFPRHTIKNDINNPNPQKELTLQTIEENGEVPCDTCGGKNKKKGDKPPARLCSALTEPKSSESKMEDSIAQEKLNDVIPCDTCGGKNKKIGGKPLPGGVDSEVHREKAEIGEKLTPQDMIPCEKCKVNREGNLASQSCGCVSNPSVCNCEISKLSRAPSRSKGDLNYGVFNINDPIPYLTTQLRIFRRRHNTWWRIAPIVTVDSVAGIFANKNISMIFSTRIGTLRQEKSARFLNHKLLIPLANDEQVAGAKSLDTLTEMQNNIGKGFLIGNSKKDISIREIKNDDEDAIKTIDTLGYFPESMKALQMCPHNDKNLCLNIRGERVPEFSIKIKIPFRENAFMVGNKHVIKISNIITDATTKDALHISIDVINKGLEAHEYSIYVYNCPLSKSALSTTSLRKQLLPDIGQSVTFLLPFINGAKKNKKFTCDVVVKESELNNANRSFFMKSADLKTGIIAKRSMDIKVNSRCFCIGRCRCHCMEKLETYINYNVCEKMSRRAQEEAGLIYNCPPGNEKNDVCITDCSTESHKKMSFNIFYQIQTIIIIILIWLLIFGLLKAIFGLCIQSIDKWGFETVQPGKYYACTSRIRIFIVNVFFFIIYPFTCWCKCFKPKPEDLMAASTDWSCNNEMFEDDCPLSEVSRKFYSKASRLRGGGHAQKISENLLLAFSPNYENGLFKDDKPDDEESTAFILEVLEESKTSLSKMMSQSTKSSESPVIVSNCAENSEEDRTAEELVKSLKASQRAYRILNSPVGGVINIPENCQYCVKGFFLPTIKNTFEFFSYHPLVQYISITKENEIVKLKKPEYLHTDEFTRSYASKLEVLKAGDLSVGCPPNVHCINITPFNDLESSFVKLSDLLKDKNS
ncbi:hypothetical protein KR200_005492, partial [Drosophila serrata]